MNTNQLQRLANALTVLAFHVNNAERVGVYSDEDGDLDAQMRYATDVLLQACVIRDLVLPNKEDTTS